MAFTVSPFVLSPCRSQAPETLSKINPGTSLKPWAFSGLEQWLLLAAGLSETGLARTLSYSAPFGCSVLCALLKPSATLLSHEI
jgi:hypothetical protein